MEKRKFNAVKGKRGFVKVDVKRDNRIVFHLTEEERKVFKEKAASKGLNCSDYIRSLLELDK